MQNPYRSNSSVEAAPAKRMFSLEALSVYSLLLSLGSLATAAVFGHIQQEMDAVDFRPLLFASAALFWLVSMISSLLCGVVSRQKSSKFLFLLPTAILALLIAVSWAVFYWK